MGNQVPKQEEEKQGRDHTMVEIILFLAEKVEGVRLREEIVGYRNRMEYVKQERLLPKSSKARLDARKKSGLDKEGIGVGIVEKSISVLKRRGYIDTDSIMRGGFSKIVYKLRNENIFDLGKLFNFIYHSDSKSSNALKRTQEFVDSRFFFKAFISHVLEVIYFYCLWDELKYPIRTESYRRMISPEDNIQYKLPLSSMNFDGFALPRMFPTPFRPDPSRKDYQNSSTFFRERFPKEGPAKYGSFLEEHSFNEFLFMRLAGNLGSFTNFFKFLEKYSEPVKANSDIRIDRLDYWFNEFWYGNLVLFPKDFSMDRKGEKVLARKVCLLDRERLENGLHDFKNFIPLLIGNMLNDPETTNEYYKEHLSRRPEIKLFDRYGVYPQKYPLKETEFGETFTKITEEGKKFIMSEVRSTSGCICLPTGLIEMLERLLGFHLDIMPLPSLDLYPGYMPEMPVSPPRLTLSMYYEKYVERKE